MRKFRARADGISVASSIRKPRIRHETADRILFHTCFTPDAPLAAREPKVQRGATQGHRGEKDAKPLVSIDELSPGLRAAEIIGAEVRSSDDKIVGEVRNIVFGTKDRRDYAIVASGGFFTPGKESIVVPMAALKVSQKRDSFFLPILEAQVKTVPLMPDQRYDWLSDQAWRTRNDAFFGRQ